MTSNVRRLFNNGYRFREVVEAVGGLDRFLKEIENDADYDMLPTREKQMHAEMVMALQSQLQKGGGEEEAEPDEEAYY